MRLHVLVFEHEDEVVLDAGVEVDDLAFGLALCIVVHALEYLLDSEDALRDLAIDAANNINPPIEATHAHFR